MRPCAAPVRPRLVMTALSVTLAAVLGCGDDPGSNAGTTSSGSDDATGTSSGTDTEDPTFGAGPECSGTEECNPSEDDPQYCVAPYDPGTSTRGDAICVQTCVGGDDLGRWCVDDAACCEGLRCNEVDGFCVPRDGGSTGTSGTGDPDTDSSGSSGSGSSGSGSSGSGSSGSGGTG